MDGLNVRPDAHTGVTPGDSPSLCLKRSFSPNSNWNPFLMNRGLFGVLVRIRLATRANEYYEQIISFLCSKPSASVHFAAVN